jgi:tRNA U34 5-carboxymethylaminomethyl modifying GTPase MnmE/TrmE
MPFELKFPNGGFTMRLQGYDWPDRAEVVKNQAESRGDTLHFSDEAKEKAETLKLDVETQSTAEAKEKTRESYIERRIREIQEKIKEIQEDDSLTEKQKQQQIAALQTELMQLSEELAKIKGNGKGHVPGGTPAKGFGSSLT